jgi:protein-tyrosine phosphatase
VAEITNHGAAKRSVLFVCSANQCRSPMAEALYRDLVNKNGDKNNDWRIESAGCWAISGLPATGSAIRTIQTLGLNIESHRSQPVTESLLEQFKLVLCMEFEHKRTIRKNFPEQADKVFLLSEMIGKDKEIGDPVGLSSQIYQSVVDELLDYLNKGYQKICQLTA